MRIPREVHIPDWLIRRGPRGLIVAYLVVGLGAADKLAGLIDIAPDEKFQTFVTDHVRAYVEKNEMPPDDIATAILNIADDLMSGKEMVLRAGDYVALRSHFRKLK